jgi:uncharacterized protein YgbK (DUF1537 family)
MIMPLRSFCIVADDLSGAADCAAAFVRAAGPVPVFLGEVGERTESLAMDTDTRTMDSAQAAVVTARTFEHIARSGSDTQLVYKKIDSTLRGHIGVELRSALVAAPQFAGALITPAFPEQGRILIDGQLRVHGRPVESLGHAGDLMALLHIAGLPAVLLSQQPDSGALARRLVETIRAGARVVVADAADRKDLDRIAGALCSPEVARLLVVGSAGLARSLALHVERRAYPESGRVPPAGPVMTVVGSFSKASLAQVQLVQESGDAQVIRLKAGHWLEPQHADLRQRTLVIARQHLRSHANVLIGVAGEAEQPFSRSVVRAMARLTAPLLEYAGTCVLTGGDTARAMFNELGVDRFDVSAEVEPGIPIGHASHPAAAFVVKAGGFGDAAALRRIIRHFDQPAECATARS